MCVELVGEQTSTGKILGFDRLAELANTISQVQKEISNHTHWVSTLPQQNYYTSHTLKSLAVAVNLEKLAEISKKDSQVFTVERKRKGELIEALRTFYHQNFRNSNLLLRCDCCQNETFLTEKDFAYLEFHHLIPFSTNSGPDHYLNLVGLCANCHRQLHFARLSERKVLYQNISVNNHLKINTIDRMKDLLRQRFLEPIHIEFLKKEGMITAAEYEKFMTNSYAN